MKFRTLLLSGVFLVSAGAFGQGFTVENHANKRMVYHGFNNIISIHQLDSKYEDVRIESENCLVSKVDNSEDGKYLLKTDRNAMKERTAKIYFVSNEVRVDSVVFAVELLPVPKVFWGHNKSGSDFSNSAELKVKYDSGVALKHDIDVVGWECEVNGKKFTGEGSTLSSEFIDYTESMQAKETIAIIVTCKGEDGIRRKMSGVWTNES